MNYVYTVMAQFWKGTETISLGLVNDCNADRCREEWIIGIGRSTLGSLLIEMLNADFSSTNSISDSIIALYTAHELQNGFLDAEVKNAVDVLSRIKNFVDFFDNKELVYNLHFFNFLWNNGFFLEDVSILQEVQDDFDRRLLWDTESDCLIDDIEMIYQQTVGNARIDGSEVFLFAGEYRIWAIALVSLREVVKAEKSIKRCKNCGKYFFPSSRSDEKYCDNYSPQDSSMTCKEYGHRRSWYERKKNDPLEILSRNTASILCMRASRNPDIREYRVIYEYFKVQCRLWKKDVKNGIKTREAFREWLLHMQSLNNIKEVGNGID